MNVTTHALLLTGYAAAVATYAPRILSRSSLPRRSPGFALALWHTSIGSAGFAIGLAAVKLMSAVRFLPVGRSEPGESVFSVLEALTAVATGLFLVICVSARLVPAAAGVFRAHRNTRRRQLDLLSLLGQHDPDLDATVIPAPTAAAYCVAGTNQVVITEHAVEVLAPRQLDAVLAHERAHLTSRHYLLVGWVTLLVDAFPGVPPLTRLREATLNLVELMADDRARQLVDGSSLATAIALLGRGTPYGNLAATGGQTLLRVERLLDPPPRRWSPVPIVIAVATPLLIAVPLLLATSPADIVF